MSTGFQREGFPEEEAEKDIPVAGYFPEILVVRAEGAQVAPLGM